MVVTVETVPPALDVTLPFSVWVEGEHGFNQDLEGELGHPVRFADLPKNSTVSLSVSSKSQGKIGNQSDGVIQGSALRGDKRRAYTGNIQERVVQLSQDWAGYRDRMREETPEMSAAIDWIDHWVEGVENPSVDDANVLANMDYVTDLIRTAEQGGNLFREEPRTAYPALFLGLCPMEHPLPVSITFKSQRIIGGNIALNPG